MRSQVILHAMLEAGFMDREQHNSNDYVNYVVQATKALEAALSGAKKPEEVADLVAAMFDAGYCTRERNPDPAEWISYAEAAVYELIPVV